MKSKYDVRGGWGQGMMSEGVGPGPGMKSRYDVRGGGTRALDEVKV